MNLDVRHDDEGHHYVFANHKLHRRTVLSMMVPMSFYKSLDLEKLFTYKCAVTAVCIIRFIVFLSRKDCLTDKMI